MRSPFRSLPIAWLQLTHGRTKLVAAVVGIVFADLLMWMQLGFLGAALASATTIHRQQRGDLIILNPHTHQITSPIGAATATNPKSKNKVAVSQ